MEQSTVGATYRLFDVDLLRRTTSEERRMDLVIGKVVGRWRYCV
jgi:hypothetical protein